MEGIPVPPFADQTQARRFWRLLSLFLHQLKHSGDAVSVHHFLLMLTIEEHRVDRDTVRCASCSQPYPCRTLLKVGLFARFPVPWTPYGLLQVLAGAGLLYTDDQLTPTSWDWYDSDFSEHIRRDDTGQWSRRRHGKGEDYNRVWVIGDDSAMCDYIADHVRSHPYPFGWTVDAGDTEIAREGAPAALAHWDEHAKYPYIAHHIDCGVPK